jgi:hypothetical protein
MKIFQVTTRLRKVASFTAGTANLQGRGLTGSSRTPHVSFAVILVGPEGREAAFGIQKDLLCARSQHFLRYFDDLDRKAEADGGSIEYTIKLPDVTPPIFGYVQRFLYDREVWPDTDGELPLYEDLVSVWHFGLKYEVDGLCDKALDAMVELKEQTRQIPGATLITKVWSETPESAPIRDLFLSWAQEYFSVADDPSKFAQSLPQAFLSALVMRMTPKLSPSVPPVSASAQQTPQVPGASSSSSSTAAVARKNVNPRDEEENDDEQEARPAKKARKSLPAYMGPPPMRGSAGSSANSSPANRRATLPAKKSGPARRMAIISGEIVFTDEQKVAFCNDLLSRMLSGPGKTSHALSTCCPPRFIFHRRHANVSPRILDAPRQALQVPGRPGGGRRARLLRQGQAAHGPDFNPSQDGEKRVHEGRGVWRRCAADCRQLQDVLEEGRPAVHRGGEV